MLIAAVAAFRCFFHVDCFRYAACFATPSCQGYATLLLAAAMLITR